MKKAHLIFVPTPGIGHLVSNIEFAKRLLDRDDSFQLTVLLMIPPFLPDVEGYAQSLAAFDTRIRYISLPQVTPDPSIDPSKSPEPYISNFIEGHKSHVKDAIITNCLPDDYSVPVCGLILDMFCTSMIDVGNELGIPSYIFFASAVSFLGLLLSLPSRHDKIGTEFSDSDPETIFPGYKHPVPSSVFPLFLVRKDCFMCFQNHARKYKETKGIIVNSFVELESYAIKSVAADDLPPIFTVGPLLNLQGHQGPMSSSQSDEIMKWLDNQPEQSVVFLCFGSVGSFSEPQLKEIAVGLEQSGYRFLWSLRKSPPKDNFAFPTKFSNYEEFMPEGFLERTKNRGRLCGWAPQIQVLAHKSIGGFMSHCGWNSILESLWYGAPIVTWPLYAEQKMNAFQLVKDLGLAVEMRMDYRKGITSDLVLADEIAKSVNRVMDANNEVRKKVKEMCKLSRQAMKEGGSSFEAFGCLIEVLLANKT